MGSSASKATSSAKSVARHFPSASAIQEKAAISAAAASKAARASKTAAAAAESSPKQDYLKEQKRLEEELAKYDEELQKSDRLSGESRPFEDTPSAAELQFFGNLRSIGQVQVPNPDQIKHQEAKEILKRKQPVQPILSSSSSSTNTPNFAQSTPIIAAASTSPTTTPSNLGSNLTSLKLMELLQLRNQDPSMWTVQELSNEFGIKPEDIRALTKYVNTYSIIPGKDAKGRETGVWCEDLRGVEVQDKPSVVKEAEEARGVQSSSSSPSSTSSSQPSPPSPKAVKGN